MSWRNLRLSPEGVAFYIGSYRRFTIRYSGALQLSSVQLEDDKALDRMPSRRHYRCVDIPHSPTAIMPEVVFKFVHSLYHDTAVTAENVVFALFAAVLAWSIWSAFYNLYLHPLARFPGPKLAAASKYWLFYQEFVKGVSLSDVRDNLHAQYGELRSSSSSPSAKPQRRRSSNGPRTPLAINQVDAFYSFQVTLFEYNPIW